MEFTEKTVKSNNFEACGRRAVSAPIEWDELDDPSLRPAAVAVVRSSVGAGPWVTALAASKSNNSGMREARDRSD
jgi:hypothetical protein